MITKHGFIVSRRFSLDEYQAARLGVTFDALTTEARALASNTFDLNDMPYRVSFETEHHVCRDTFMPEAVSVHATLTVEFGCRTVAIPSAT